MDGCPFFLFLLCLCVSEKEEEEEDALALTFPFRQLPPFTLFPYFLFPPASIRPLYRTCQFHLPLRMLAQRRGGAAVNFTMRKQKQKGLLGFARGAVKK